MFNKIKKTAAIVLLTLSVAAIFSACGDDLKVDPTKNAAPGYVGSTSKNDYDYDVFSDSITITKYTGNATELDVPDKLNDLPVTKIKEKVFSDTDSRKITKISLPASISEIDPYAFYSVKELAEISIRGESASYVVKDGVLMSSDMSSIVCFPPKNAVKSYKLPDTVTSLSGSQFANCSNLTTFEFSPACKEIGNYAFLNCSALKEITIPNTVKTIGTAAFLGCSGLETISFPKEGVESINETTLGGCINLKLIKGYSGTRAQELASELGVKFESLD